MRILPDLSVAVDALTIANLRARVSKLMAEGKVKPQYHRVDGCGQLSFC